MSRKRNLFIGSSEEALGVAKHVKSVIEDTKSNLPNIKVDIWNTTPWQNLKSALDSLNKNIDEYYYAIFIGYPDSKLEERGNTYFATRDNTLFEFGLFFSRFSSERTFFLRPSSTIIGGPDFKMLSDVGSSSFVLFYDLDFISGNWTFKNFNSSQLISFLSTEEQKITDIQSSPQNILTQLVSRLDSDLQEENKNDEYYINKLKNGLEYILYAKIHATGISIKELTRDTLNAIEDVKDFCKPLQLAEKQRYSNGIRFVWVFSSKPFEFLLTTFRTSFTKIMVTTSFSKRSLKIE